MLQEWESHEKCLIFTERLVYDMGTRTRSNDPHTLQARLNRCCGTAYIRSVCELAVSHQGPKDAYFRWRSRPSTGPPLLPRMVYNKLSLAAFLGDKAVVASLIDQGADVNHCDLWLGPPLNAAVLGGHLAIVGLLLKHRADPNVVGYLGPPVMIAVKRRDEKMVQLLLQNHMLNPNLTKRESDENAVYLACSAGDTGIVKLLLAHKRTKLKAHAGNPPSPLEPALLGGHERIAELLLSRKDLWPGAITYKTLSVAQQHGRARMLRLLLDAKQAMSVDYTHESRWLLRSAVAIGQTSIVEALLERPDNNPHHCYYGSSDDTHLLVATMKGHYDVVRALLQRPDIQPDLKRPDSPTPLYAAVKEGHEHIVELLLSHHAVDKNSKDPERHRTPLIAACAYGQSRIMRMILTHPAIDTRAKDDKGRTAASYAAENGRILDLRFLLEYDSTVLNDRDEEGQTPLLWAAKSGHVETVRFILQNGGIIDGSRCGQRAALCLILAVQRGFI